MKNHCSEYSYKWPFRYKNIYIFPNVGRFIYTLYDIEIIIQYYKSLYDRYI